MSLGDQSSRLKFDLKLCCWCLRVKLCPCVGLSHMIALRTGRTCRPQYSSDTTGDRRQAFSEPIACLENGCKASGYMQCTITTHWLRRCSLSAAAMGFIFRERRCLRVDMPRNAKTLPPLFHSFSCTHGHFDTFRLYFPCMSPTLK
jgi:hypothetical protein